MTQAEIFQKLESYLKERGRLREFCRDHSLPYSKVWKFAAGDVKEVTYEFGQSLAQALSAEESIHPKGPSNA